MVINSPWWWPTKSWWSRRIRRRPRKGSSALESSGIWSWDGSGWWFQWWIFDGFFVAMSSVCTESTGSSFTWAADLRGLPVAFQQISSLPQWTFGWRASSINPVLHNLIWVSPWIVSIGFREHFNTEICSAEQVAPAKGYCANVAGRLPCRKLQRNLRPPAPPLLRRKLLRNLRPPAPPKKEQDRWTRARTHLSIKGAYGFARPPKKEPQTAALIALESSGIQSSAWESGTRMVREMVHWGVPIQWFSLMVFVCD